MKRGRKIRAINGHPETRTHTKPTEIYHKQIISKQEFIQS